MADRLKQLLLLKLKAFAILLLLALFSLLIFSFTRASKMTDDVWKQLGITRDQGLEGVKQSFLNGYLYCYGVRNARNIAINNRAGIASNLLLYTKQYVSSPVFKKEYDKIRMYTRPAEPQKKIRSKEEIRKEKIAETEESIKKTEATIKQMGADMAKIMQPTLDMLKKTLADYKDPNSKHIEAYALYEKNEYETSIRSYKERLGKWEKEFPADSREIVKQRLQKFLALSSTVDFKAELKKEGNKLRFVNPTYEAKPYDWKQVFRAGNEVITIAREFAEQWMRELN